MSAESQRKSNKYVDPEVQGALTRRLVLQWLTFLVTAAALAFAMRWMADPFAPLSQTLTEAWWTYGPLLLVLACLAPVFIYDAIKLSHRFTGPILRLRQVVRAMASGENPTHVEFRGADFWRDLAADFNRVSERLTRCETGQQQDEQ